MTVRTSPHLTADTAPGRTAIFAATRWELGAVLAASKGLPRRMVGGVNVFSSIKGASEFWVVRTGVGPQKAGLQAAWLLRQQRFGLVVSTGFACALNRAAVGDLVVGDAVMLLEVGKAQFTEAISPGG